MLRLTLSGARPLDWGKSLQGGGFIKNTVLSEQCGTSRTCTATFQELLGNYITLHTPLPNIDKHHDMAYNVSSTGVMFQCSFFTPVVMFLLGNP